MPNTASEYLEKLTDAEKDAAGIVLTTADTRAVLDEIERLRDALQRLEHKSMNSTNTQKVHRCDWCGQTVESVLAEPMHREDCPFYVLY